MLFFTEAWLTDVCQMRWKKCVFNHELQYNFIMSLLIQTNKPCVVEEFVQHSGNIKKHSYRIRGGMEKVQPLQSLL